MSILIINSLRRLYVYYVFVLHKCLEKVSPNDHLKELISLIIGPLIANREYSFDKNINIMDLILNPIKNNEYIIGYKNEELTLKTNKFTLGNCTNLFNNFIRIDCQNECSKINTFLLDVDALISSSQAKKQLFGENCNPDHYYA